jgi:hypothetical protein
MLRFRIHILSGSVKIIKLPKMCNLCNNNESRTYTHARHPHHRKLLLALFKQKKIEYEKNYPFLL